MNPIKLDELRRAALKAGRGEMCLVDAEDLLELLEGYGYLIGLDEQREIVAFETQVADLVDD